MPWIAGVTPGEGTLLGSPAGPAGYGGPLTSGGRPYLPRGTPTCGTTTHHCLNQCTSSYKAAPPAPPPLNQLWAFSASQMPLTGHPCPPPCTRYWAFSADQMALIDLPATIDYILHVTGYQQVGAGEVCRGCMCDVCAGEVHH